MRAVAFLLIASGLLAAVYLVGQRQELRKRAEQLPSLSKRVLLVIYDPIVSNGQKLHQNRGWNDPTIQASQIISFVNQASRGAVNYQIVNTIERSEWPRKIDGFRYTEASYTSCMDNSANCHQPDDIDYAKIWSDINICQRVTSGEVDEVIIFAFPYAGSDEFAFKIPGDRVPYNNPTNPWMYPSRKKNIPDCNGKTVFVMGYSYEVGIDNALESYLHRIESALGLTVGRGDWNARCGTSDFDRFTCLHKDIEHTSPPATAGCGQSHFAPNSVQEYTYDNPTSSPSTCSSWDNYPLPTTTENINCQTWGCTKGGFYQWWMNHLPRQNGVTSSGNLKNWWKYIVDFDNAVTEAKAGSPTPTPRQLIGDIDRNGVVDIFDYNILVGHFGPRMPAGGSPADLDRDGDVDIFDYNKLVENFGRRI